MTNIDCLQKAILGITVDSTVGLCQMYEADEKLYQNTSTGHSNIEMTWTSIGEVPF